MSTPTRREALIAYLKSSVDAGDWHAVRDAAVDIEVLEAAERAGAVEKKTEKVRVSVHYTPEGMPYYHWNAP